MTRPGWPSCCGTSRPRCSAGYAATGSCTSPPRHGAAFRLAGTQPWPVPAVTTVTETTRYGTARAAAWGRLYQQLAARAGWDGFDGELPMVKGTSSSCRSSTCPATAARTAVRLWSSRAGTSADQVDRAWQAFLRRFDIEHAFPFFKQALGWTRPKLRGPAAADRGPGSSLPATPSSTSPAASPPTSGCPGSAPARLAARPHATTLARRPSAMTPRRKPAGRMVT
jgi:hypothetical protein